MKKRGISAIVATVLIVLISVASIGIVWVVILPMLNEDFEMTNIEVELSIVSSEGYTAWDQINRIASVHVERGRDNAEVSGIDLIFALAGNSVRHYEEESLEVNSKKVYYVNLSNYSGGLESIKVAPIFGDGGVGEVTSEVKIEDIGVGNLQEVINESINSNIISEIIVSTPNGGSGGGGGSGGTSTPSDDYVCVPENCVIAQASCCDCDGGGSRAAYNSLEEAEKDCEGAICAAVISTHWTCSADIEAVCVDNSCELTSPLKQCVDDGGDPNLCCGEFPVLYCPLEPTWVNGYCACVGDLNPPYGNPVEPV
jgi:hypothetical protein